MGLYVGQEKQEKEMDNTVDEDAEGWGKRKHGQEAPSKGRTWNKKSHDNRNLRVKCVHVLRPQGICSNQGSGASRESLRTILQHASHFTLSLPAYHAAGNKLICYCTEHPFSA